MTEKASDRTKRTFTSHLAKYNWNYQLSVRYTEYSDALNAISHGTKIRKAIPRKYPNQAFLWRLVLKGIPPSWVNGPSGKKTIPVPYHTFFTNLPINGRVFKEMAEALLGVELTVKGRTVSASKIADYIKAVKKQRPHDLKKIFGSDAKIHRFSLLNGKQLTTKSITDLEESPWDY